MISVLGIDISILSPIIIPGLTTTIVDCTCNYVGPLHSDTENDSLMYRQTE